MEDASVTDFIALLEVVAATVFLLTGLLMARLMAPRYPPLQFKDIRWTAFFVFAALKHIFGAFLANEPFHWITLDHHRWTCSVVNIWVQYLLGLGLWMALLTARVAKYGTMLDRRLFHVKRGLLYLTFAMLVLVPMLLIAIVNTSELGTTWNAKLHTCSTEMPFKIAIFCWILWSLVIIAMLNLSIRTSWTIGTHTDFVDIRVAVVVGLVVISVNGIITFLGFLHHPLGRLVFISAIVLMHVVTFISLIGAELYGALTKDRSWSKDHGSPYQLIRSSSNPLETSELSDLAKIAVSENLLLRRKFMLFATESDEDQMNGAVNMVRAVREMDAWRNIFSQSMLSTELDLWVEYKAIMQRYFDGSHPKTKLVGIDMLEETLLRTQTIAESRIGSSLFDSLHAVVWSSLWDLYGTSFVLTDEYRNMREIGRRMNELSFDPTSMRTKHQFEINDDALF